MLIITLSMLYPVLNKIPIDIYFMGHKSPGNTFFNFNLGSLVKRNVYCEHCSVSRSYSLLQQSCDLNEWCRRERDLTSPGNPCRVKCIPQNKWEYCMSIYFFYDRENTGYSAGCSVR